jgi:hypothetical protein
MQGQLTLAPLKITIQEIQQQILENEAIPCRRRSEIQAMVTVESVFRRPVERVKS